VGGEPLPIDARPAPPSTQIFASLAALNPLCSVRAGIPKLINLSQPLSWPETPSLLSSRVQRFRSVFELLSRSSQGRVYNAGAMRPLQMAGSSRADAARDEWNSALAFPALTPRQTATLEPRRGGSLATAGVDVRTVAHAREWAAIQRPQHCRRRAQWLRTLVRQL
jgi:hypothetical protein